MDYDLQRCTRRCAATGRELRPGEAFYSALVEGPRGLERLDYSIEGWSSPPEGSLGWWKSQLPDAETRRPHWVPNDLMLHVFEQLEGQPERDDFRYLLALLLVRRRVLRFDEGSGEGDRGERLSFYCPRRDANYSIRAVEPDPARVEALQGELARLLTSGA